ncbi:MAG: hypothetical protein ACO31E_05950 [Phycisphaerales bacterium]|jgi:hypothetical protein
MKTSGLAIALALGLAGSASADSLTLTFLGFGNPTTTAVRYDSSLSWSARSSASYSTLTVGTHRWGVYGQERTSFCTQLFEGVTEGQTYTFDVVDPSMVPEAEDPTTAPGPMGEVKAQLLNDLYRRYYAGLSGAVDTGAFQIAIYEITHENLTAETAADAVAQLNLAQGAFQASKTGGVYATAAQMLASLGQGGFGTMGPNLLGLMHASAQDQLLVVPIGAPAILAGLGLVGVGIMRRRMK